VEEETSRYILLKHIGTLYTDVHV